MSTPRHNGHLPTCRFHGETYGYDARKLYFCGVYVSGKLTPYMAISKDEHAFFVALGARIAAQRKQQDLTQVELAERLGISQQAMNSFEKGRRRVPVSLLLPIVQTLDTTLDALADQNAALSPAKPKKRGPPKKAQRQLQQIETLPPAKQRAIAQVLDSMLGKQPSP